MYLISSEAGSISLETYNNIKPVGSQPRRMYCLCKVHKEPKNSDLNHCPPFRPILSAINTASYNIAKFLIPIMEPHTKISYVERDSFYFVDDLMKQTLNYL